MPRKGYWIECVPVNNSDLMIDHLEFSDEQTQELYKAILSSIPDLNVVADTPDQAIERLRRKLRALNRYYKMKGQDLPEMDNPVRPPRNLRSVQGWISVYVQFSEGCH